MAFSFRGDFYIKKPNLVANFCLRVKNISTEPYSRAYAFFFFGPKQVPDWNAPAKADFPFQILSSYFSLNTSLIVCESVQALHFKLSFHISICCMESI